VLRIRKKTFYLQFCMRTPQGHLKCEKTKIHMGSMRQSLQAQPKNINQSKLKLQSKSKKSQIKVCPVWGLPDGVCRLNPKSLKNHRNTKSTNQNEHFPKKTMFCTLKM
jgi:hypothetical protein